MLPRVDVLRRTVWIGGLLSCLVVGLAMGIGCGGGTGQGQGQGEGPGHRSQYLGLTPEQELSLGTQAYREILAKYHGQIVRSGPQADAVERVGERIVKATRIKPLQREVNLHFREDKLEWQFTLLNDKQVNAFCLPGGKVAVFTGLFSVAANEDELAAVMGHEIGHALAHHASERIYRDGRGQQAALAADQNKLSEMNVEEQRKLTGLMAVGAGFSSLAYEREQETEADHIGLFLMTFAGYNPEECVRLWQRMAERTGGGRLPEIFSDHPSDARRIAQMRAWVPQAIAGKKAYDTGHYVKD